MRWLWVSRARFDDLREQLRASEAERLLLAEKLLKQTEALGLATAIATIRQEEAAASSQDRQQQDPVAGNPFDRILLSFNKEVKAGKISPRYRAH